MGEETVERPKKAGKGWASFASVIGVILLTLGVIMIVSWYMSFTWEGYVFGPPTFWSSEVQYGGPALIVVGIIIFAVATLLKRKT